MSAKPQGAAREEFCDLQTVETRCYASYNNQKGGIVIEEAEAIKQYNIGMPEKLEGLRFSLEFFDDFFV